MDRSKIVVVTDIQKVPAKLAQGFHFLVDQYNPKIDDAVFIFTMLVSHYPSQPNAFVNDILNESWSELDEDTRQALIVRVTDSVLPILREDVTSCPLKTDSTVEIYIP